MLGGDREAERVRTNAGARADDVSYYSIEFVGDDHPPHGLLQLSIGPGVDNNDLMHAQSISPAAVEWVRERQARRRRLLTGHPSQPTSLHTGTIFPNLSLNGFGTAIYARTFI